LSTLSFHVRGDNWDHHLALYAGLCAIVRSGKGVTVADYGETRTECGLGTIFAIIIVFFIVVSTAATLKSGHSHHRRADAARALSPLAGKYAETLFGIGLFWRLNAAAGVLPLQQLIRSVGTRFEKGVSAVFVKHQSSLESLLFLVAVARPLLSFRTCPNSSVAW